ncbi:MAG: S-methyl-5-thioribose-1-phosphate isomerase [Actinomycetota bacterium]|nr:S-methyl-5-thioribose-1-phosphate isomerase [Actinomycetota bacterium]
MASPPDPIPRTIEWRNGRVRMLDQRALPDRLRFLDCATVDAVCDAITSLAIRGAPALGAAGAYGVALAAATMRTRPQVRAAAARLAATRPTAVNLAVGVDRALVAFEAGGADGALAEAVRLADDDVECNQRLGAHGAVVVPDDAAVLTHCNAGALACVGYGTAIGVVRSAVESGKRVRVWVDETRPVLQGARLTAWELAQLGIPATLIADATAASLMARGEVDVVIVGADRVAANGDVANKIGTYGLAVLARHHDVPFYVAAPTSTIDVLTRSGDDIRIEERDGDEVRTVRGTAVALESVAVFNPAFDVTPARLVTGIITEVGIARPPYRRSLPSHVRRAGVDVSPRS